MQACAPCSSSDDLLSPLGLHPLQVNFLISGQASGFAIWHGHILLLVAGLAHILDNHAPALLGPTGGIVGPAVPVKLGTSLQQGLQVQIKSQWQWRLRLQLQW